MIANNKYYLFFLLYIFPICAIFDFSIGYFDDREYWVIAQATVLFLTLFFGIFFNKKITYNSPTKWILTISFFFFLSIPFSSNIILTSNMFLKFFLSSMFYCYSFHYTKKENDFYSILKFIIISCFISYAFLAYSTFYEIGRTAYKNQFLFLGYQSLANQFIFSMMLIAIYFFRKNIFKKSINHYVFSAITIIVLILSFRRTNFLILLLGILFLIFKMKFIKSFFLRFIPIIILIFFIFGDFFLKDISTVLENRDRILKIENYKNEGRFIETKLAFDSISKSLVTLFFGSGNLFNSANNYGFFAGDYTTFTRPIHNDYARILFGGGVVGLILYLIFLSSLYSNLKLDKYYTKNKNLLTIYYFSLFVLMTLILVGFSSGLTDIFYRIVVMSILGSCSKILTLSKINENSLN